MEEWSYSWNEFVVNPMRKLVCCLEEPSSREMLKNILPKLGVQNYDFIVFEGKQDLHKRLPRTLKAWQDPNCLFLILRDQDSGDCCEVKKILLDLCADTGKSVMVRIACHELESFYLGDLVAVEQGLNLSKLAHQQNKKKFRNPDYLSNPAQELSTLTRGTYQKVMGSRTISKYLNLSKNRSRSFNVLIQGISSFLNLEV
jgi:hypothetical protein